MKLRMRLQRILKIYWPMKVTNEEIRFKTNMEEITQQIKRRHWKLIGHVLRKSVNENTRIALTWTEDVGEVGRRTVDRERGEQVGQKSVVVRRTEKLGERERKALFPSEGKGQDDDDDDEAFKNSV